MFASVLNLQRFYLAAALAGLTHVTVAADPVRAPESGRSAQLLDMVRQDCGSCHGLTLKGGLGPALLPSTLQDKAPLSLQATILYGRPGTAMPPWKPFLTEAEAEWIVEQLMKGLPDAR